MCGGSSPKAPPPPPRLPEAPTMPDTTTGSTGSSDLDRRRRRAASGKGANSTILTSSRGADLSGRPATKTLLGE